MIKTHIPLSAQDSCCNGGLRHIYKAAETVSVHWRGSEKKNKKFAESLPSNFG